MKSFEGRPTLQFAVFADYGRGWNKNREFTADDEIAGAGVGLRWNVREHWAGHIYWADQLIEVTEPQDESLQDQGWHFRVAYQR